MKKISAYLIILWIFCYLSMFTANIYAADEGSSSAALPQGIQPQDKPLSTQAAVSQAQDIAELRAFVDKSSITIGEKVTYTLEIDIDNNSEAEFPSYVSGLGGFAVKDFGSNDKKIGRNRTRKTQWYLLDTYTTGSYIIPAQSVKLKLANGDMQVLTSPEIFVEVKSVIDAEEKAELRDIKEPLSVDSGVPAAVIIAAILISLAVAGVILWKLYLKKIAAKKKIPLLLPETIAFQELERIEGLGLIEKKRVKEYYYLVSLALRTYLENRFSLKAPEQTTEEFLESVVSSDRLQQRHIDLLKEYLNHCDLVKFAKFDPGESQAKLLVQTTRNFIEETTKEQQNYSDKTATEEKDDIR